MTNPPPWPARSAAAMASASALTVPATRVWNASGFFETTAGSAATANKKGNFGFHRLTQADYSVTMRTSDGTGSGHASIASPRVDDTGTRQALAGKPRPRPSPQPTRATSRRADIR